MSITIVSKKLTNYYSVKTIQSETAFDRQYARLNQAKGIGQKRSAFEDNRLLICTKRQQVKAHAIAKNFDEKFASVIMKTEYKRLG